MGRELYAKGIVWQEELSAFTVVDQIADIDKTLSEMYTLKKFKNTEGAVSVKAFAFDIQKGIPTCI